MQADKRLGLLANTSYIPSPNCDARPDDSDISALVIHAISMPPGEYGGLDILNLFCNKLDCTGHPFYSGLDGLQVSSHLLIRRDGEVIQFVPFLLRAWHAGVSTLGGRTRVNDFAIGIELEGSDYAPFEEPQYQALVDVSRAIQDTFPMITTERIVGHADIAPGRKTDPGPYFNWKRYRNALKEKIAA